MDEEADRETTPQSSREQTTRRQATRTVALSLLGAAVLIPAVCFYLSKYLVQEKRALRQRRGSRRALPQGFMVSTGSERISIPLTRTPEAQEDDAATVQLIKASGPAPESRFVASSERDKFHVPGCRWAARIQDENLISFESREDALAAGLAPCGTCDP